MKRQKLSIRVILLIFFIFSINLIAGKFYWYSLLWWFDMPMHFLGGLWLGLAISWIFPPRNFTLDSVMKILLGVFLIGVAWEVYEVVVNNMIAQNPFDAFDTASDLFFDLAGGATALAYVFGRIMPKDINKI